MKEQICQILSVKNTSYYSWKKNTHVELIVFMEKVTYKYTPKELSNWIEENQESKQYKNVPVTDELAALLNISKKNIYTWRIKKPLLFNLIYQLFYSDNAAYDIENAFDEIFNIPNDLDDREEDVIFAEQYDKELINKIFNISEIQISSKLVPLQKTDIHKILYIFKVLKFQLDEGYATAKIWMKIFLELEGKWEENLTIEQMFSISKLLEKYSYSVANMLSDLLRDQEDMIKYNINTLSNQEINYLLLSISCVNNIDNNDTKTEAHYIKMLEEIKNNKSKTLSLKILSILKL
ncbi:MAG: hypothetical protein DRG78_00195 [Epsilonproteobacteria bacterium]|nr:MAG: hypothetical protein DRG78_00195 [Campylobacterota bacterium]